MNIVEIAKNKGITVKNQDNQWRVMFGDNIIFDTNMISSIERFLDECEFIEEEDALALKVSGFLHFRIEKLV